MNTSNHQLFHTEVEILHIAQRKWPKSNYAQLVSNLTLIYGKVASCFPFNYLILHIYGVKCGDLIHVFNV